MVVRGQLRVHRLTVVVAFLTMFVVAFTFWTLAGSDTAAGARVARLGGRMVPATPVAGAVTPADPLDGEPNAHAPSMADPLDGEPPDVRQRLEDLDAPEDLAQLTIERSGRPKAAMQSNVAYDGRPETVWTPGADLDESWLWFDVGDDRRIKAVRWRAVGAGAIEVAVSVDRQRWETLESVDVTSGWDGVQLREDARYVRLSIAADDDREASGIAEVTIYGLDVREGDAKAQFAGDEPKRKRDRKKKNDASSNAEAAQETEDDATNGRAAGRGEGDSSGATISTKKGKTHCKGDRGRCRAREGKVSVEEDCASNGSCTIDVRADGGSASCDASGGRKNKAGDGEGKRTGDGGECEAIADGGAVAIGDIDP